MRTNFISRLSILVFLVNFIYSESFSQIPLDGLIGYYTFDGHTNDSSGFEHDGDIFGDFSYTQDHEGNNDSAILLKGGYVDIGNPQEFQMTDFISISAWIKPSELTDWHAIVSKWDGFTANGYYLGINPEGNLIRWNIDMPTPIDGDSIQVNTWTHIVATHDGDTTKLYMDGQLIKTEYYEELVTNNNANVLFGSQNNDPENFTFIGALDDIVIYNRAINQEEVNILFNHITTSNSSVPNPDYDISIYPNPTDGFVYLKSEFDYENMSYSIIDTYGKNVQNGEITNERIDLSSFPSGIYFIRLIVNNRSVVEKIILK